MMEQLTIDHAICKRLAEEGMARTLAVESDAWIDAATAALKRFAAMPEWHTFKCEDFRAWYLANGGTAPHDPNVWGGLTGRASKSGVIRWTGRFAASVSPKTHGHPVRVWTAA